VAETQLRVRVVDDEEAMRALVKRFLEDDCTIAEAGSGPEALTAVPDTTAIEVLITDEMMPEMEGHELARRFRMQNPDLKVLYLTGFADRLFDAKDNMWAAEAYLDKPFTRDGLRQALAQLVFGRQTL
jgi:two-component system, cell cycle sensor histidine kinase and response regulator CckA